MEFRQIIGTWFSIFTDTDRTIKALRKEKLGATDGILSTGAISLLTGVVLSLAFVAIASLLVSASPRLAEAVQVSSIVTLAAVFIVLLPILAIIGLLVFTALLRGVSMVLGGAGEFGRDCGVLGLVFGFYIIAMVPLAIGYLLALGAGLSNPLVAVLFMGLGILVTTGLQGLVQGAMLELLSEAERLSVSRSGMLTGFSWGIVIFTITLLSALLGALVGTLPSSPLY